MDDNLDSESSFAIFRDFYFNFLKKFFKKFLKFFLNSINLLKLFFTYSCQMWMHKIVSIIF